jgi:type I restriction enzyme S subunit
MELKQGYKRTEVGVIPESWEVHQLCNEIERLESGISVNSIDEKSQISAGDKSILKTSSVYKGNFLPLESKKIIAKDINRAKLNPRADTIIISRMNTPDLVGECGYVDRDYPNLYLPDRLWMTQFRNGSKVCVKWLNYLLNSKEYSYKIKEAATGTSGSMKNISKGSLFSICIPFPTESEQRAIAAALSDVDALITSLDRLINKKRDMKQATMQELLTGKRRMSGFIGEWAVKKLGEIGTTYGGLTGKSKADFGTGSAQYIPFLNVIGNVVIDPNNLESVRVTTSEYQNLAMTGDLFFNGSSETPEEVGMCSVLLDNFSNIYLNSFCFGFRLRQGIEANGLFLAYFFRSGEGRALLYSSAQGATRYNLSKVNFLKLVIPLPELKEQTAIATILSDMDADIATMKQKLDKTRMLKHGMMQELLTGRIRLA